MLSINPGTAAFLSRGIESAEKSKAKLIIVRLDTPGGLASSMRTMVKSIMNSSVPVVVYVSPSGARAASAGALDRAQLKRAWPAIVAEIKKRRNSTGMLFTTAAVDADGDTLVVEFPADQKVTKEIAEGPDAVQMLRQAAHHVLGVKPPVRYQLGRGSVKHEQPAGSAEVRHHVADGGDTHPQATGEPDPVDILASEFGDVVVEHHEED